MKRILGAAAACAMVLLLARQGATADQLPSEAEDLRAKALAHRHMDSSYAEPGYLSNKLGFPRHCRALTQAYESVAKEAENLAKAHRAMADAAGRNTR